VKDGKAEGGPTRPFPLSFSLPSYRSFTLQLSSSHKMLAFAALVTILPFSLAAPLVERATDISGSPGEFRATQKEALPHASRVRLI